MKRVLMYLVVYLFVVIVFITVNSVEGASDREGVKIGIIDTGFNTNHPDLENLEVKRGTPSYQDYLIEFFQPWWIEPPLSHGNATAGIISETAGRDKGAGLYGYYAREFDCFIDAIRVAVYDGAKIINVSLDSGNISIEEKQRMQAELDQFFEREKGIQDVLIVAGAGNSNELVDNEPLQGLASKYDNIIVVGSVDPKGNPSSFTSYGETVTIAAPGENIRVAQSGIGFTPDYDYNSGTSWSAAYVSGVAASILEANPDLTPGEIKEIIMDTAEPHQFDNDKPVGAGVINAEKAEAEAIERIGEEPKFGTIPWTIGPNLGGEMKDGTYTGELKDSIPHGQGKWTSPAGESYDGEWENGDFNGYGTWTGTDDHYVGEWKDNLLHGKGIYTHEGHVWDATFKEGVFQEGTHTNPEGEVFYFDLTE